MKKQVLNIIIFFALIGFLRTCLEKPADTSSSLQNDESIHVSVQPVVPEEQVLTWELLLVNKSNPLSEDYTFTAIELKNGHAVDERIYSELQAMMDAARAEGLEPLICSSYRTIAKQQTLYQNKIAEYVSQGYSQSSAENEAAKWVAKPGTSEHHTGLALDIVSTNYQLLDEEQEHTPEQQWLMQNAHRFGFILRYPNYKCDITGIYYEPWHYRYVGKEVAKVIYEQRICLEEYLQNLQE